MTRYFLLLDAHEFGGRVRHAFTASWDRRSFAPIQPLCRDLLPAAAEYAERFHLGGDEPLLARVAEGLPFDRTLWRHLVGETLLYSAREIPEFPTCEDTLTGLVADADLIRRAHHGSRDLTFGTAVYRPDEAGWHNPDDVASLARALAAIRPETWHADALAALPDLSADDRDDELAYARDWFPSLAGLYARAHERRQVVVIERIF